MFPSQSRHSAWQPVMPLPYNDADSTSPIQQQHSHTNSSTAATLAVVQHHQRKSSSSSRSPCKPVSTNASFVNELPHVPTSNASHRDWEAETQSTPPTLIIDTTRAQSPILSHNHSSCQQTQLQPNWSHTHQQQSQQSHYDTDSTDDDYDENDNDDNQTNLTNDNDQELETEDEDDDFDDDPSPRENRVLTFADEHGSRLCHVLIYDPQAHRKSRTEFSSVSPASMSPLSASPTSNGEHSRPVSKRSSSKRHHDSEAACQCSIQ